MFFLCIFSRNLDEFFEIRVSGLKKRLAHGLLQPGPDGLAPAAVLSAVSETAHRLVDDQYEILNRDLLPGLEREGIRFLARESWSEELSRWVASYFNNQVLPVMSPMGLDPAHPVPEDPHQKSQLYCAAVGERCVRTQHRHGHRASRPRSLPRLIPVPQSVSKGRHNFVFLSSIIHAHVGDLFPGMDVSGCYQFRLTRNGDLSVENEEVEDLLRAVQGELPERRFGSSVRLEVAENCPRKLCAFLLRTFSLTEEDLYTVNGPVNLGRIQQVRELLERPELEYPPFTPRTTVRVGDDVFDVIRRGDILLHHPFDPFSPVVEFIRQAANDPDVLAIKQTLYRASSESAIVDALVDAARGGKEVTVIIELRARFDEEANIQHAHRLQDAGAHVAYGVVGHKTHAKLLLVVRREGRRGKLRCYVHLGTGNYHEKTVRSYTDFGLITCDEAIGGDVLKLFQQLTGLGKSFRLKRLLQAPFTLQ